MIHICGPYVVQVVGIPVASSFRYDYYRRTGAEGDEPDLFLFYEAKPLLGRYPGGEQRTPREPRVCARARGELPGGCHDPHAR